MGEAHESLKIIGSLIVLFVAGVAFYMFGNVGDRGLQQSAQVYMEAAAPVAPVAPVDIANE